MKAQEGGLGCVAVLVKALEVRGAPRRVARARRSSLQSRKGSRHSRQSREGSEYDGFPMKAAKGGSARDASAFRSKLRMLRRAAWGGTAFRLEPSRIRALRLPGECREGRYGLAQMPKE